MNKQDIIISLLKEIDKNIDNVNDSGGTNANLKELTVTANGEYLPADHNADGFSKVTAKFDTSSLPKVKVSSFKVTNDCIDEDGRWVGVGIDTSPMTNFGGIFTLVNSLKSVDISGLNIENGQYFEGMFNDCENLTSVIMPKITSKATHINNFIRRTPKLYRLDTSGWDTSNVTNMTHMFYNTGIQYIDATSWNVSNCATGLNTVFLYSWGLISVVGDRTLKEVVDGDIAAFNGAKSFAIQQHHIAINTASILALVNGLADLTGQTTQTITLGGIIGARLDTEQIAGVPAKEYLAGIANNKNWTIAY